MIDILVIILAALLAVFTILLYDLLGYVSNPWIRIIVPLACGVVLALVFFTPALALFNPSSAILPLIYFFYITFPLIFPLFIIPPLIFIEKRAGTPFGKSATFIGSFTTIIIFKGIQQSGLISYDDMRMVEFFLWTGGVLLIAFVVFFGIVAIRRILSGLHKDDQESPDKVCVQKNPDEDKVKIINLALGLLLLGALVIPLSSPVFMSAFFMPFHDDNRSGANLLVNPVNVSEVPDGTVINLTDEKLQKYPELASLVKKPDTGMDLIPCKRELQMQKEGLISPGGSSSSVYLEYQGKYYTASILHYAGTHC
jgi:hypothetical protein